VDSQPKLSGLVWGRLLGAIIHSVQKKKIDSILAVTVINLDNFS